MRQARTRINETEHRSIEGEDQSAILARASSATLQGRARRLKPKKVYFFWITRNQTAPRYFRKTLGVGLQAHFLCHVEYAQSNIANCLASIVSSQEEHRFIQSFNHSRLQRRCPGMPKWSQCRRSKRGIAATSGDQHLLDLCCCQQ